ncbi:hypothetical protein niasHT_015879 [Heterodera trifolii]|uniref:Uncharacterized protein n=1 Tax=Heterodera trifolii TaxID=157864 RepID=A0ABD2LKC2_9BILA
MNTENNDAENVHPNELEKMEKALKDGMKKSRSHEGELKKELARMADRLQNVVKSEMEEAMNALSLLKRNREKSRVWVRTQHEQDHQLQHFRQQKMMEEAIQDHERRRSVVVQGLPEPAGDKPSERVAADRSELSHVLDELGVECPISSYRMGPPYQAGSGHRPRLIKIILPASKFQRQLLAEWNKKRAHIKQSGKATPEHSTIAQSGRTGGAQGDAKRMHRAKEGRTQRRLDHLRRKHCQAIGGAQFS